jgi:predicted KAP-like P-loop ATPase
MPGPLNADQPIKDPEDDLLGVAPFAHTLAESILKMAPANGFVMALPGEWGSGNRSATALARPTAIPTHSSMHWSTI